jgi:hypothetical protein
MSFTSHTFTSLPLVHTLNPDFFETTTLTLLLTGSWMLSSGSFHAPWFPNSFSTIFPNFADSRSSWLRRFKASSLHEFATSGPSRFKTPSRRAFATSRVRESSSLCIRDFKTSWIPDSRSLWVVFPWKLTSQIWLTSTFRGWRVFLNSPTNSTSRTTSRIHSQSGYQSKQGVLLA